MVTEKSYNLSQKWVDLPREKGSGTSWASSDEHLQSNTYRKDLSWLHFDKEPRFQGKQQVKEQQSCISL